MKRVSLLISGRVQGVNYRYFVYKKAKELGLKGWVKNLENGKVEAIAEGSEEKINLLIETCRKGSLFSKVTDIEVKEEKPTKEFDDFQITY